MYCYWMSTDPYYGTVGCPSDLRVSWSLLAFLGQRISKVLSLLTTMTEELKGCNSKLVVLIIQRYATGIWDLLMPAKVRAKARTNK